MDVGQDNCPLNESIIHNSHRDSHQIFEPEQCLTNEIIYQWYVYICHLILQLDYYKVL